MIFLDWMAEHWIFSLVAAYFIEECVKYGVLFGLSATSMFLLASRDEHEKIEKLKEQIEKKIKDED